MKASRIQASGFASLVLLFVLGVAVIAGGAYLVSRGSSSTTTATSTPPCGPNDSCPSPVVIGSYATRAECSQHANTSQKCVEFTVGETTRWKVLENPNVPPPCGPTENCVEVQFAIISNSCAPGDAPALKITTGYDSGNFSATVFDQGLEDFLAGKSVSIDGQRSGGGTGIANICYLSHACNVYEAGEVVIESPSGMVVRGTPTRLNLHIKGNVILVDATWDDTPATCG